MACAMKLDYREEEVRSVNLTRSSSKLYLEMQSTESKIFLDRICFVAYHNYYSNVSLGTAWILD